MLLPVVKHQPVKKNDELVVEGFVDGKKVAEGKVKKEIKTITLTKGVTLHEMAVGLGIAIDAVPGGKLYHVIIKQGSTIYKNKAQALGESDGLSDAEKERLRQILKD